MASLSTRRLSMNSDSSNRGGHVNELTGREMLSESAIERNVALVIEADPDVERHEEQPPAVSYLDDAGKPHKHTFDFRVFLKDGTRVAIAVKDRSRVEPTGIRRTLKLIESQVGSRFAERFIVRTQDDAPRSRVANAKLVLLGRKVRDDDAVETLAAYVRRRLRGSVRIVDLLEASGIGIEGFMSVVALIDCGLLELASPERIAAADARVRPTLIN